jgi:Ca2+/Na+ antiporter
LIGLVIFLSCVYDGKIETNEAIAIVSGNLLSAYLYCVDCESTLLFVVYLVYVVMVILIYHHELHLRRVNAIFSHYPQIASAILRSASLTSLQSPAGNSNNSNAVDETEGLLEESRNNNSNTNNGASNGGMLARITARPSAVRLFPGATTPSPTVPDSPRQSLDIPPSSSTITTDRGTFLTLRNTSSRENSFDRDASASPSLPSQSNNNSNHGSARYRGSPSPMSPMNNSDSPGDLMLITETSLSSMAGSHAGGERGGSRGNGNVFEDIESAIPATTHSTFLARTYELIVRFISIPIRKVFQYIMPTLYTVSTALPSQHPQYVPLSRAITVLLVCFLCISLSASLIVMISESLIKYMHIDSTVVGATLVAFGSEIPDALSAIALARNGYFDGAIAGALGSQVINISIGVGLPSLIVGMTSSGGHLSMDHHEADR